MNFTHFWGQYRLFGFIDNAIIANLGVSGSFTGKNRVGGIAGYNSRSTVNNCYATVSNLAVSQGFVGGLIGSTYESMVNNCYATGSVSSTYIETDDYQSSYVGGLIGSNGYGTVVNNCYAIVSLSVLGNSSMVGGLIGRSEGKLNNCYAAPTSLTTTSIKKGILIGSSHGYMNNCYYSSALGIAGLGNISSTELTAKTDTELKASAMVDVSGNAGNSLNYNNNMPFWKIDAANINNGYPILVPTTTHILRFDANGGSGNQRPLLFYEGVSQNLMSNVNNDVRKQGYLFASWNTEVDGSGIAYSDGESITINESTILYAQWTPIIYNLYYYYATHSNPTTYTVETPTITLGAVNKIGYTFDGWYNTSFFVGTAITHIAVGSTEDKWLYAKWEPNVYNITYTDGGTHSNPATYTITTPNIILTTATKAGYTFGGWYDNADFTGSAVTQIPVSSTGDKVLYAKWTVIVTFDTPANGTLVVKNGDVEIISGTAVASGTVLTITTTPASGYSLESLKVNGVDNSGSYTVTAATTIVAVFKVGTGITKPNLVLTLYPNPATNQLTIDNVELTMETVEIFDMMGRLVLQTTATEVIDVSTLSKGIYTVKAGSYRGKFVK